MVIGMSEQEFKKWILKNATNDWLFQTIETSTGSGVPDLFVCTDGYQGWIELKSCANNRCYMRISQWRWMNKLSSRGGCGLLVIKRETDKRVDIYNMLDLRRIGTPNSDFIKGVNIIFPPYAQPAQTYKLGSGNQTFYAKLKQELIRGQNNEKK